MYVPMDMCIFLCRHANKDYIACVLIKYKFFEKRKIMNLDFHLCAFLKFVYQGNKSSFSSLTFTEIKDKREILPIFFWIIHSCLASLNFFHEFNAEHQKRKHRGLWRETPTLTFTCMTPEKLFNLSVLHCFRY